jgi:hypothetical protein
MQHLLDYIVFNHNFLIYHNSEIQHLLDITFSNYNLFICRVWNYNNSNVISSKHFAMLLIGQKI